MAAVDVRGSDGVASGVIAGLTTKALCSPFDRIRLLYQVQHMFHNPPTANAATPPNEASVVQRASTSAGRGPQPSQTLAPPPPPSVSAQRLPPTGLPKAATGGTASPLTVNGAANGVKYTGMRQAAMTIVKEEGVAGLWRGAGANMLRASVVYGVKFGTNDYVKQRLRARQTTRSATTTSPSPPPSPSPSPSTSPSASPPPSPSPSTSPSASPSPSPSTPNTAQPRASLATLLLSGSTAGLLQKTLSYPLDVISVRIALGVNTSSLSNNANGRYSGVVGCAKRIYLLEGSRGLYKGFGPTLATGVPYVTLQMTFFELFHRKLNISRFWADGDKSTLHTFFAASIPGSLAGVAAQTIVFPGDTVRKRMMANGCDGHQRLYRDSFHCARVIYGAQGICAFYHGLVPCVVRALPSGAIQFGTFESAKRVFNWMRDDE